MGECLDWCEGDRVVVHVPLLPICRMTERERTLTFVGEVSAVGDEFVDVRMETADGDRWLRFHRTSFDCAGLEVGKLASVDAGHVDEVFDDYPYDW